MSSFYLVETLVIIFCLSDSLIMRSSNETDNIIAFSSPILIIIFKTPSGHNNFRKKMFGTPLAINSKTNHNSSNESPNGILTDLPPVIFNKAF